MSINVFIANDEAFDISLNVSNQNFYTIWNSLGLDSQACSIYPLVLLDHIRSVRPELMCRNTVIDQNYINIGIDLDRVNYYITALTNIAMEAVQREEKVVWG